MPFASIQFEYLVINIYLQLGSLGSCDCRQDARQEARLHRGGHREDKRAEPAYVRLYIIGR